MSEVKLSDLEKNFLLEVNNSSIVKVLPESLKQTIIQSWLESADYLLIKEDLMLDKINLEEINATELNDLKNSYKSEYKLFLDKVIDLDLLDDLKKYSGTNSQQETNNSSSSIKSNNVNEMTSKKSNKKRFEKIDCIGEEKHKPTNIKELGLTEAQINLFNLKKSPDIVETWKKRSLKLKGFKDDGIEKKLAEAKKNSESNYNYFRLNDKQQALFKSRDSETTLFKSDYDPFETNEQTKIDNLVHSNKTKKNHFIQEERKYFVDPQHVLRMREKIKKKSFDSVTAKKTRKVGDKVVNLLSEERLEKIELPQEAHFTKEAIQAIRKNQKADLSNYNKNKQNNRPPVEKKNNLKKNSDYHDSTVSNGLDKSYKDINPLNNWSINSSNKRSNLSSNDNYNQETIYNKRTIPRWENDLDNKAASFIQNSETSINNFYGNTNKVIQEPSIKSGFSESWKRKIANLKDEEESFDSSKKPNINVRSDYNRKNSVTNSSASNISSVNKPKITPIKELSVEETPEEVKVNDQVSESWKRKIANLNAEEESFDSSKKPNINVRSDYNRKNSVNNSSASNISSVNKPKITPTKESSFQKNLEEVKINDEIPKNLKTRLANIDDEEAYIDISKRPNIVLDNPLLDEITKNELEALEFQNKIKSKSKDNYVNINHIRTDSRNSEEEANKNRYENYLHEESRKSNPELKRLFNDIENNELEDYVYKDPNKSPTISEQPGENRYSYDGYSDEEIKTIEQEKYKKFANILKMHKKMQKNMQHSMKIIRNQNKKLARSKHPEKINQSKFLKLDQLKLDFNGKFVDIKLEDSSIIDSTNLNYKFVNSEIKKTNDIKSQIAKIQDEILADFER